MVFNNVSSSLSCPFGGWLFWPDWKWFGLESLKGFPIHSQILQKALRDRIKQAAIIVLYLQAKYSKTRFFCTSFWLKLDLSLRAAVSGRAVWIEVTTEQQACLRAIPETSTRMPSSGASAPKSWTSWSVNCWRWTLRYYAIQLFETIAWIGNNEMFYHIHLFLRRDQWRAI